MQRTLKLNSPTSKIQENQLKIIKDVIVSGGLIAIPTDTFYGIGTNPLLEQSISKLFKLKERLDNKPILVLIGELSHLTPLTSEISETGRKLMEAFWPGPLTLLFKAAAELPENLTSGTGKVGVRFPKEKTVVDILKFLGHALTASSANLSGTKNPKIVGEIQETLKNQLDLILDNGPTAGGLPSTVLDPTVHPPQIIREGALPISKIESTLGYKCKKV